MAELPEGIRSHVVWVPLLWPARSAPCFMSKSSGLTTQPHSDGVGVEDGKCQVLLGRGRWRMTAWLGVVG